MASHGMSSALKAALDIDAIGAAVAAAAVAVATVVPPPPAPTAATAAAAAASFISREEAPPAFVSRIWAIIFAQTLKSLSLKSYRTFHPRFANFFRSMTTE